MVEIVDKSNSYWVLASSEYSYLQESISLLDKVSYFNILAVQCQQIAEKYLKAIIYDSTVISVERQLTLLHSHSLQAIYSEALVSSTFECRLKGSELKFLSAMYYDARYPGDNFIQVDVDTLHECIEVLESVRSFCLEILTVPKHDLGLKSVETFIAKKTSNFIK